MRECDRHPRGRHPKQEPDGQGTRGAQHRRILQIGQRRFKLDSRDIRKDQWSIGTTDCVVAGHVATQAFEPSAIARRHGHVGAKVKSCWQSAEFRPVLPGASGSGGSCRRSTAALPDHEPR